MKGGSSADKTKLYWWGQEVLYSLCHLNQHLDNIYFLAHKLDLKSLQELNKREHFDIVLVFLVLHMITTNKTLLAKYIDTLLELGNDLIIEMSLDVFPILDDFVHKTCKKKGGKFIGELPRSWDSNLKRKGRFYWFKNPNRIEQEAAPISQKTFEKFNGVYP